MSEGELPHIPLGCPNRKQRSDSVVQLSQFYANLNSTLLNTSGERGAFVDQYNHKNSKTMVPDNIPTFSRVKLPENADTSAGNKSSEAAIAYDSPDKLSSTFDPKKSYLKLQSLSLAAEKQKKSVRISPKSFIAEQYKAYSESPIFYNQTTSEEGRSTESEAVPSFQKVKTSERNVEVVRWKKQEFPSEDAFGSRHSVVALSRWLNSMYSKIPACKAWPPSVSNEEMSTAFERFLSTFSKDIFLNSTHPECLNAIMKSVTDQPQLTSSKHGEQAEHDDSTNPDEVLMPFRASIEVVDAVAGEIIRQISHDCSERAMLLDKVITQYKVVLREAWIMKQRAETEGITGLRNLIRQCEELLISESKARVVAECSNEHHVIKAQANERKIQSFEKELLQSNVQLSRMRDQIDHCHRQLQEKDNSLECKTLFLKDAQAANEVKQLHLESVLLRERQWEDKVRAMGSDPNCFLGIDVGVQADEEHFQVEPTDIARLITPPEVRKARIERDAYAKSMAQLKKAESMSLSMKDLEQSKKVQSVAATRSTIVNNSIVDTKAQKEKEVLAQQLKDKDSKQLSLLNQFQQQAEAHKLLQEELLFTRKEANSFKDSIKALEISLAESEAQRQKSQADVLILLEETDALQKKQNGTSDESVKFEEILREAKANLFKEQLLVTKLQGELESWKESESKLSAENVASKEHASKQRAEIQNLNSKLIVLERDLAVATVELKKNQHLLEEKNVLLASQAAVVPAVICAESACQTDIAENQFVELTQTSPDKLKKVVKAAAPVPAPAPILPPVAVVDEGPAHEKIKKATLQLRSDLKKKNEENQALSEKIKENDEKMRTQQAVLEEKSAAIAKILAEKKDLVDKNVKLQSQLEIACRPPAPTERVVDAVAALQVIGALSQMQSNSNQHEANEKLKRQLSMLKEQEKLKLPLAQVLGQTKSTSAEPEKTILEKRKVKTPLLPAVVNQKIQVTDEACGDGDEEMHSKNREQVLKLLAAAQGIGKVTKKFRRQVNVSHDVDAETNDTLQLEMRLQTVEEKCELLTQNNENLRTGNAHKSEEISRLSLQVQKLKDELAVLAEQRATWLKDEQKRIHLESSVENGVQQTKKMMESVKKGMNLGNGAFKAVVNLLQADKQKPFFQQADEISPLVVTASVPIYVPKPEIPAVAIPYMQFLKEETIETPKQMKSEEWLNTFFEDLMSCKVSSDRYDRIRNCYHDDVGDYMFALLTIRLKSVPKALKALSTVHCCANNLRRTNLQNDLIYGILAQRYDNEQASFYWWMHQEVGNGSLKIEEDGSLKPEVTLRFLKDIFLQQNKGSLDSQKTLTADTVSLCSRSCSSIHHFYDIALTEYNQQKSIFWYSFLKVLKIEPDLAVSKASIQNAMSYLHPTWTTGQTSDMTNALLQGHSEVPFLGFVQMFHAYHFFARKLALPRRGNVTAGERNGEDVSILVRKQELIELLPGFRVGFSQLFAAKMCIPPDPSSERGKTPMEQLVAEK